MMLFDPQTWTALAGAAYLTSASTPGTPGLYGEQFVPGRGTVIWSIDKGDPALARTGMTRKVMRAPTPRPAGSNLLVVYSFGRRAIPLHRSGRTVPGLMLTGGIEKRDTSPRGCGGFNSRCESLGQARRISIGLGYGTDRDLLSLTYFNDRILRFGAPPFYIDGGELSVVRTYDHLF